MSDTALFLSLALVFAAVVALLAYIVIGNRKSAASKDAYRWKPEQDYDVELRGETPMSPGFPTLVKRNKSKGPPSSQG